MVNPSRKADTEVEGSPAAMTAGGTNAGTVVDSRFDRTVMYTALPTLDIAERMDPAAV